MTLLNIRLPVRSRQLSGPGHNGQDAKSTSALSTAIQEIRTFLNREIIPLLQELRARFNERHGHVTTVTADYKVEPDDEYIRVDASAGNVTLTLMPAASWHRYLTVKKIDSTAGSMTVSSSELIDGAATRSTATQYAAFTVVSTGTTYERVYNFS